MIWAMIVGMGAVLLVNRYLFLEPRLPLKIGRHAREFLGFAVPGMLTAICGPLVFMPGAHLDLSLLNPYLLGASSAVICMLCTGRVLTSVVLSVCVFYLLRWLA